MKKWVWFIVKLMTSIFILVYLFLKIDLAGLKSTLITANWFYVVLALCLYIAAQVLNSYKWALLVETKGVAIPFWNICSYYFMGMFLNLFLPSIVGGDIPRGYYLYKDHGSSSDDGTPRITVSEAISTVMMQRATGVFALIIIASIAYFGFFYRNPTLVKNATDAGIGGFLTMLFFILVLGLVLGIIFIYRFKPKPDAPESSSKLRIFLNDIGGYLHHPKMLNIVIIYSFIFQASVVLVNIVIGKAINAPVPLIYYFVAIPIIALLAAIPISFNGMGVREGSYIFFLGLIGIDKSVAFSIALLWLFIVIASSLLGAPIFIFRGTKQQKSEARS
jgi:hypothetical protein